MATIYGGISIPILDGLGISTTYNIDFQADDAKTIANVFTFANDLLDHLSLVMGGGVTTMTVSLFPSVTNILSPDTDSEIERTGVWNYLQNGIKYKYGSDTPALKSAVVVDGRIDLTNSDVAAWIEYLKTAHSGFQAVSKAGRLLTSFTDALISFRKHRALEERRSKSSLN